MNFCVGVDGIVSADRHGPGQNEMKISVAVHTKIQNIVHLQSCAPTRLGSTDLFNMCVDTVVLRCRQSEGKGTYQKSMSTQMPDFSGHKRVTMDDYRCRFTVTQLLK